MGHDHNHHHHHHTQNKIALLISFLLISAFVIIEFIGGMLTNSLALLSDAGHMLSDSISLGIGLLAFKLGEKAVSESKTFGYKRLEILAAFLNGMLLIGIAIVIMWEALDRFNTPQVISGHGMLAVAVLGAIINIMVALILAEADTGENMNMKAVFLHVIGDLLGSVGAILAALLILFFGWSLADPIVSLLVSILIIRSGFGVAIEAIHVLMEGTPHHLDGKRIREKLLQIPSVVSIHDFHAWSITSEFPTISCHLVISSTNHDAVLKEALKVLHDDFGVEHVTIQVESTYINLEHYEHHRCNSYTR